MKRLNILIITAILVSSCASNNAKHEKEILQLKKEILELELKNKGISPEKEKTTKTKVNKKEEIEPNTESQVNLKNYKSKDKIKEDITHQIDLGKHYGVTYTLYTTNRGTFWLKLSDKESIDSISLLIPHKNKSPEFINFIQISPDTYETKADTPEQQTKAQLSIKIKNKKTLVFNLKIDQ